MKILIFIGSFVCQTSSDTLTPLLIKAAYIDLTEKTPEAIKPHIKTSLSSDRLTCCTEATIQFQFVKFCPTKFLLKEIFSTDELKTLATVSCFLLTILNKPGNLNLRALSPSQVSSQNRVCFPLLILK